MTVAYPLQWPHWVKRTENLQTARFTTTRASSDGRSTSVSILVARERLQSQLDMLGARNHVLSTNAELTLNGQPRRNATVSDVGAAVYFTLSGKQMCMPCDKWDRLADNIAAIAAHIDAIRRIERYGVQSVEEAFSGFVALDPPFDWRRVLNGATTLDDAERVYRDLARTHHPDRGGSAVKMAELNRARDQARAELGA